ncbi:MAG TPA: phosphotransferase [Planctomycetota bacterium]|nr:phosphotransferase [Planctomycetota bacterium]
MKTELVRELKRDVFGRVELVRREDGALAIRRVACGSAFPGSRLVARVLLARERRALERLAAIAGVPRVLQAERGVLLRDYQEGVALSETEELAADFFERLAELVREVHARGVCHNDLHKEQNVIVGEDGRPALVDFQLASVHRVGSRLQRSRAREDLRHVEKHRRRYLRDGRGPEGSAFVLAAEPPLRRSFAALAWKRTVKPVYVLVTRKLLSTRDGEARRRSDGTWPRWTAARGPRPR